MIQFNLLPDVKLEYIRTRRLKRMYILVAGAVGGFALAVLVVLFLGVAVFQKEHLNNLSTDINNKSKELREVKDLDKILTIQNQLNSLTSLHDEKKVASRLPQYLQVLTPPNVTFATVNVDFGKQTMTITGTADKISTVNQYVDTLKFTTYAETAVKGDWVNGTAYVTGDVVKYGGSYYMSTTEHTASSDTEPTIGSGWKGQWKTLPSAFSEVVLSSFGRSDKGSSYTITFKYDPTIFSATKNVTLTVPNIITTRSETQKPQLLFEPISKPQGEQ